MENDLVINTVTELIEKEPNITIVDSAKVKEYSLPKGEEPVSVFLENGTEYKCNLLVSHFIYSPRGIFFQSQVKIIKHEA